MKIATEFQIGDVAYIPAIKPSEYHSFDEATVTDINIQVSNLKILYSVETTEGRTTAVSADKIFKSPSMIPAAEKEYKLLKLCSELVGMIKDVPADFTPRTKEVKDAVAYFKSKNPEAPAEVKAETEPKPERLTDEEKKQKRREYMRDYMREYARKRWASPEGRAKIKASNKRYVATPEGKAKLKASQKRYKATPKGREAANAANRRYRARKKAEAKTA